MINFRWVGEIAKKFPWFEMAGNYYLAMQPDSVQARIEIGMENFEKAHPEIKTMLPRECTEYVNRNGWKLEVPADMPPRQEGEK